MKEIRLKRKTIIILVLSISMMSVIAISQEQEIRKVYAKYIPLEFRQMMVQNSKATIYDEANRLHDVVSEKDFSLYQLVWYTEGSFHSGASIQYQDGIKIFDEYYKYREEHNIAKDFPQYYIDVTLSQWFSSNITNTKKMLADIDPLLLEQPYRNQYYLIKASVALSLYEIDDVNAALYQVEGDLYNKLVQNFRAYMYHAFGIGDETDIAKIPFRTYEDEPFLKFLNSLEYYCKTITNESHYSRNKSLNNRSNKNVHGNVSFNGQAYNGIIAYLDTLDGSYSGEGFDGLFMPVDSEGHYAFNNIPYATKSVGFILPIQLISDKVVSFPWYHWPKDFNYYVENDLPVNLTIDDAPVVTNAYVDGDRLYVNVKETDNSYHETYRLTVKLDDPKYPNAKTSCDISLNQDGTGSVSLAELRENSSAPYAFMWNGKPPTLMDVTEPLYLSDYYLISIHLPGQKDVSSYYGNFANNQLTYPIWIPGEDEYNQGDRLIAEEKFEQAIEYYEANPSLHNLKTLFNLYSQGYTVVETSYGKRRDNPNHEKAIIVMEKLIDEYGENYSRLSSLYYEYRSINDYINQRRVLERQLNYSYDKILAIQLALLDAREGDIPKAIASIDELKLEPEEYSYVQGLYLLANEQRNIQDDILTAYRAIDKRTMKPYFTLLQYASPQELYDWLNNQAESDLVTMYKLLLLDEFSNEIVANDLPDWSELGGFHHYYVEQVEAMESVLIKSFLKQLKEENNWFH